jgi:hypothetical protein
LVGKFKTLSILWHSRIDSITQLSTLSLCHFVVGVVVLSILEKQKPDFRPDHLDRLDLHRVDEARVDVGPPSSVALVAVFQDRPSRFPGLQVE